jgi:hypothetical protein
MLATTAASSWQYEQVRTARLAQMGLFQEVRRPRVDVGRLRLRLECAFLRHGWLVMQPERSMAVVTHLAGGPSEN